MMTAINENEVRYRIEQAFSIAPTMTVGMLKAYLNARVPIGIRTSVLEEMKAEGKIKVSNQVLRSYRGMTTQVTVLQWMGSKVEATGRAT
jgi:hypothetical protein